MTDPRTVGMRIRHFRTRAGLTLDQLAAAAGCSASQLSLVETGKREPRLSLLQHLARELGVPVAELLSPEPPSRRAALELALEKAQQSATYAGLGLPRVRVSKSLPTEALEALVGLHSELARRVDAAIATPEEARRANTELRGWMRERDNYLPEVEEAAREALRWGGYTSGALTHRSVARMAEHLGFTLLHVDDLPHSTRTVTDLANGRIYLPPASIPGGHGLRSLALQAIGHRVLGHDKPRGYADFLRQRLEISYFAAACLVPRDAAVAFLTEAKKNKDLAVEDFRDAFGITHETAAQRLTNLMTSHLDLRVHFLRVGDDGAIYKGFENDGMAFPTDSTGAIEGQPVCRQWPARVAFTRRDRTTEYHQYTDTPSGTYWSSTQTGTTTTGAFSISFGVPYADAKWFRGRDSVIRRTSMCPDETCCKRPDERLTQRFVDRRTSVLLRHLKDKRMVSPEINELGEVRLEGHLIGTLEGFRFTLARNDGDADIKGLRAAADQVVAPEIRNRADRLAGAPNEEFVLATDGRLRWKGDVVAELIEGDALYRPRILMLADESLTGPDLERVQDRLGLWLRHHINTVLEGVMALEAPAELEGAARGIAFQLFEHLWLVPRPLVADEVKGLDQDVRGKMRKLRHEPLAHIVRHARKRAKTCQKDRISLPHRSKCRRISAR